MAYEMDFVDLPLQPTAVVCGHLATGELATFIGAAFGEVMATLGRQGQHPTGAPFGRYRPTAEGEFDVEVGFPCSGVVDSSGRVEPSELPAGRAARTLHVGAYDTIGAAYEATIAWLTDQGYEVSSAPWESYLDGPDVPEPRTEVFVPCTLTVTR